MGMSQCVIGLPLCESALGASMGAALAYHVERGTGRAVRIAIRDRAAVAGASLGAIWGGLIGSEINIQNV